MLQLMRNNTIQSINLEKNAVNQVSTWRNFAVILFMDCCFSVVHAVKITTCQDIAPCFLRKPSSRHAFGCLLFMLCLLVLSTSVFRLLPYSHFEIFFVYVQYLHLEVKFICFDILILKQWLSA
jgi:hypothetical protein